MDILFWCFMAFLAFLVLFPMWWDSTEAGRFQNFLSEGRAAGLSVEQSLDELSLRTAYVRLRRELSEECVRRGGDMTSTLIREMAAAETDRVLRVYGKDMGKRFAAWIGSLSDRELMLPAAWDLYVAHCRFCLLSEPRMEADPQDVQDFRNAMRTERGV